MVALVSRRILVFGKHVAGDLYECSFEKLTDVSYLLRVVQEAARAGNMTLLDIKTWKIGLGVSIVGIVLESHISIHTWPEYRFATVDVYSCGSHTNPEKAFEKIVEALEARRVEKRIITRHYEE
ncbi:MAG TPA: adenosylmethionine decarboxylase [Ignisphaera sp.]|nr:adenosylmethionine decarboxylase [Ignisphaera sp.]